MQAQHAQVILCKIYHNSHFLSVWLANYVTCHQAQVVPIAATSPCPLTTGRRTAGYHIRILSVLQSRIIKQYHRLRVTKVYTVFIACHQCPLGCCSSPPLLVFGFPFFFQTSCSESSNNSQPKGTGGCTVLVNCRKTTAWLPFPWNGDATLIPAHIVIRGHVSDASKRYRLLSILTVITCRSQKSQHLIVYSCCGER